MVNDSKALRPPSALGTCAALACLLVTAAPAAAAGAPGPDPTPAPAPDPYTAPAHPRVVVPASHQVVRTPLPSRPQVTVRPTTTARPMTTARTSTHTRPARRPKATATQAPAQQPHTIRTGPVRSFSDGLAAAVETTTHRLSRTLALAVALLVLLSGAFVLTAAREIER